MIPELPQDFRLRPLNSFLTIDQGQIEGHGAILLLAEGQGKLNLREKVYTLRGPEVLVLSIGNSFSLSFKSDARGSLLQWEAAFLERAQFLCPKCDLWTLLTSKEEAEDLLILALEDMSELSLWAEQVSRDLQAGKHGLLMELQFTELVLRLDQLRKPPEPDLPWLLDSVTALLEEGFAQDWSLREIAAQVRVSEEYLSRRFSKEKGMALFEYLNHVRIRKACQLLKRTNKSILQIAMEVGYNNQSFFGRYFKRIMGVSPREYRK
jgi:AraC-like DNA-binding protein